MVLVQVQMGPYSAFTDKPISLNKSSVVYIAEPNTDILNSYNKMFGSGLVVPNQKIMGSLKLPHINIDFTVDKSHYYIMSFK